MDEEKTNLKTKKTKNSSTEVDWKVYQGLVK